MEWGRLAERIAKLIELLSHPTFRRGLRHGVAAGVEHRRLLRALRPQALIDIGANVGQFSLAVKAVSPGAVIHAFEPLASAASVYRALFKDDADVRLYPFAAGEQSGRAALHVSRREDSSSMLPIAPRQSEAFPGTEEARSEDVEIRRVDALLSGVDLPRPVLAKLDVQGFELSALKGMTGLMSQIDFIYAEVSFVELYAGQPLARDVVRWLATQGFELEKVEMVARARNGEAVQADLLFRAMR